MLILGIETSCDDTSLAIVKDGSEVLSHVTASQIDLHNETGGVVPEIAAREHLHMIVPVLQKTLEQADLTLDQLDAVAVTKGPGLVSSLLIGDVLASTIALLSKKPLIPLHHIEGHIYGNWLERHETDFHFPIMILTASGGHNELILMKDHHTYVYLGRTRDDAAGEAFDKVARVLGLGYPGGPAISKAAEFGDPKSFHFPRAWMRGTHDFSFSGLKSEILRVVEKELQKRKKPVRRSSFNVENTSLDRLSEGGLSKKFIQNVSASFQECVVDILSTKLLQTALEYNVSEIHLAGGVSANSLLRSTVEAKGKQHGLSVKFPVKTVYSTDNGAMIAAAAYYVARKQLSRYKKWAMVLPDPNLKMT